MMHFLRPFPAGMLIAGVVLASSVASAAPNPPTPQPPTYVVDASFRPQLTPPPTAGSARARAEMDEILALNKSRTEDQYWRVVYWDRRSALGPWIELEQHAIAANVLNPVRASRALSLVSAAVNDAIVVSSRVRAEVRRTSPCEILPELSVLDYWCPEYSYPSEHAVVAGAASTVLYATVSGAAAEILAHFFPKDAGWLRDWAKTAARSRLYGGIHTTIENETGLRLGQQVAGATLKRLGGVAFAYE